MESGNEAGLSLRLGWSLGMNLRLEHSLRNLKPHIIMRAKLSDNMNEWVRVHILPWGQSYNF